MGKSSKSQGLDDVQVLGEWNFTLQSDTPLYWLRCGALDRYLLRFTVNSPCPSTCGIVFHAEADGSGTDGTAFWIERRQGVRDAARRYIMSGDGLESKPVVTRTYPDDGLASSENIEVLVQGSQGAIFVQNRQVQIRFRTKVDKGSLCFYNTTQGAANDDVHFSGVAITALRRGPLEISGDLANRERQMHLRAEKAKATARAAAIAAASEEEAAEKRRNPYGSSVGSTQAPQDSLTRLQFDDATTATGSGFRPGAGRAAASPNFRATVPAGGSVWSGSPGSPSGRGGTQGSPWGRTKVGGSLRQSASDSVLKKSAGTMCGLSPAGRPWQKRRDPIGDWLPLATNPPRNEQQLLKDNYKHDFEKTSCTDFVPIAVL